MENIGNTIKFAENIQIKKTKSSEEKREETVKLIEEHLITNNNFGSQYSTLGENNVKATREVGNILLKNEKNLPPVKELLEDMISTTYYLIGLNDLLKDLTSRTGGDEGAVGHDIRDVKEKIDRVLKYKKNVYSSLKEYSSELSGGKMEEQLKDVVESVFDTHDYYERDGWNPEYLEKLEENTKVAKTYFFEHIKIELGFKVDFSLTDEEYKESRKETFNIIPDLHRIP